METVSDSAIEEAAEEYYKHDKKDIDQYTYKHVYTWLVSSAFVNKIKI